MPESRSGAVGLFPEFTRPDGNDEEPEMRTRGIVPSQDIRQMVQNRQQYATPAIEEAHIQPASLDLRLGDIAHRVRASFLPGPNQTVESRIKELRMTRVDLTSAAVFEKDCVYIVPLLEEVNLPADIYGRANPKSTTGRLDIFTRLITDYGIEFEQVRSEYKGPLYVEIVSRTFTIIVSQGTRLNQLRFIRGNPSQSDRETIDLHSKETLVYMPDDSPSNAIINEGVRVSVSLEGDKGSDTVAYKAKRNAPAVDLSKLGYYPIDEFWDAVPQPKNKRIRLYPGDFYILASKEKVRVPADFAAEMVAFDPSMGEFRIHYAGFFDPGFGYGAGDILGTRAVLEVRAHEVPFLIEDGQIVCRLLYTPLVSRPDTIYGVGIGSNYQRQGLALSKQFQRPDSTGVAANR